MKPLAIALTFVLALVSARAETTATPAKIIVSITLHGRLFVNGIALDRDEQLEPKLRTPVTGKVRPTVAIAADVKAPKGRVVFVIGEAKRAGITKVEIVTSPPAKT